MKKLSKFDIFVNIWISLVINIVLSIMLPIVAIGTLNTAIFLKGFCNRISAKHCICFPGAHRRAWREIRFSLQGEAP